VGACIEEGLGDQDGGASAVGGWGALEFGQRGVDHGGVLDFVVGVGVAELGVRVALRVFVGDAADFCERVEGVGRVGVSGRRLVRMWMSGGREAYFSMYSLPALAKYWAFRGLSCLP
jgi:hypothetical protein